MDKPSTSENKDGFVSSPATVSPGQEQKSRSILSPNVTPSKIRKIANEQSGQSQSAPSSQDQNLAQGVVSSQLTNEDPLACFRSQTDEPQTVSSSIDVAFDPKEIKERLKQAPVKREKVQGKLKTLDENTEAMKKQIQNEVVEREEIGQQQNIHENSKTLVKDEPVDVKNEFEGRQTEECSTQIHNDAIPAFYQLPKDPMERTEAEISKHNVVAARLEAKKKELSLVRAETERLEAVTTDLIANEAENQQRHNEEIEVIDRVIAKNKAELDVVREKNIKLKSLIDENLVTRSQLSAKYEALRAIGIQKRKQIEDLKSLIRDSQERRANTITKIEEWKSANLAIISERDAARADYEKQIEALKAKLAATSKKLSDTESTRGALIDSLAETVNDIEKLKKISDSKDRKIQKLRDELRDGLDLNKDLSAEAESLKESLADVKKQIAQEKADFETLASEDQSDQLEIEIQEELTGFRRQFEEKKVLLSKLHEEMEAESLNFSRQKAKFHEEIVDLDKQLDELQKSKEDCKRDMRKLDSEMNKKLHESTQTSAQCLKAGHEKQINQQNKKLETLRDEISAVEAEYQREIEKMTKWTNKRRADREAKLEESKSEILDLEKKIAAAEKIRDDRKQRLTEARVPGKADSGAAPMIVASKE